MAIRAGCARALAYFARLLCLTVNSKVFVAPIIVSQYYDKFLEQEKFLKRIFNYPKKKSFLYNYI
jgi:hypothetical protein